ncbi:MAG: trigger factor [Planctomycetaceae bacterium]
MAAKEKAAKKAAEEVESTAVAEDEPFKMSLDVDIADAGPCRKHVKVRVPRADIDHYFEEAVGEFSLTAAVPGFRVGHVPVPLIQRRFKKELAGQVKQKILLESLEQLADDKRLDPINEPDFNVESLDIPDEGDFEYEFDVEVRPDFELPSYDGLKLKRPVRETTDDDVEAYLERFLSQYGQFEPHEGEVSAGDFLSLSIDFTHDGKSLHKASDVMIRVKPTLRFRDAELSGFDKLMKGAKEGDKREADVTISREAELVEMRGETVHASFEVLDVKRMTPPELTKEFLTRIGVESEEDLRKEVRSILDRQLEYDQRQSARSEVLNKITESAKWELPEQLVLRQVDNALRREILEMQQAGFTTQEIQARENEIRQRAVSTTRQALKEHFVLDRIATQEKIEVTPHDIEMQIALMAMQRGESPRRVRARLAKSGMIENLEAQIRERKAVDFILERAKYEDVKQPRPAESQVEAVPISVCGFTSDTEIAHDHDHDHDGHDHDHG